MKFNGPWLILFIALLCWPRQGVASDSDRQSLEGLKSAFIANYAELLHAEYDDALEFARRMQAAIDDFLKKPGPETLEAARNAWVLCRDPYLRSEVGRFYDGPIDGIEGYINAWPIDENYLDYTVAAKLTRKTRPRLPTCYTAVVSNPRRHFFVP